MPSTPSNAMVFEFSITNAGRKNQTAFNAA
jgi:hypothetical protein